MEPLPIPLIAWVFTAAGLAALLLGAYLLTLMYKAGRLPGRDVDYTVWNDVLLLGVWGMSFLAGMGLLNHKTWAPRLLEYFCIVLIVFTLLNALTRLKVLKQKFDKDPGTGEFPWKPVLLGNALVVVPIVAFCALTIHTLNDPGVRDQLRDMAAAHAAR